MARGARRVTMYLEPKEAAGKCCSEAADGGSGGYSVYIRLVSVCVATLTEAASSRIGNRPSPADGGESRHLELCASNRVGHMFREASRCGAASALQSQGFSVETVFCT